MTAPIQMVFAGQGPMFIGNYDPINGKAAQGYLTGVRRLGASNRTLKISLKRDTGEINESDSGMSLLLAKYTKKQSATIELDIAQFSRNELAMALYGESLSRVNSTVTGEVCPTVAVGDYIHTKHPGITSLVVTDSAGTPATLVAGTNYSVDDAAHGRILITNLGSLVQPFKLAYSYAAYSQVTAFTATTVQRGIIFDGVNIAQTNAPVRVIIPFCDFDPTSGFDWIGSTEAVMKLSGSIMYASALSADGDWGSFMRIDSLPADA